jgi:hypothetical protein
MTVKSHVIPREDPRLDWSPQHDSRSRAFGISDVLGVVTPEPKFWETGPVLDQGREGACVGFGWTGEALASPRPHHDAPVDVANALAMSVYRRAKEIDQWPGEAYDGTSVLAGAKVMRERKVIGSYRWAFSVEQLRDAIITEGPAVIGIPWFDGMYETRPSSLVEVTGSVVGGHCILVTGYHPRMRISGEGWFKRYEVFRWRNSWGTSYGKNGNGLISITDLDRLVSDYGEMCIPMDRRFFRVL